MVSDEIGPGQGREGSGLLGDEVPVAFVRGLAWVAVESVGPEEFVARVDGGWGGRGQSREEGEQGESGAHGCG